MNFNKKVVVTKHALERMEERHVNMCDKKFKKYDSNKAKFVAEKLRYDRIKKIIKVSEKESKVITTDNYILVVIEKPNCNLVVTVIKQNRERIAKKMA